MEKSKMTDVNVQYFSHLNGLSLGNNWGDLINLLDVCLVNGLPFSSITSATISELGDINLTLSTAHNAMLFQIVELSGFSPSTLNKKYRIKGVPSTTQLILKADLSNTIISAVGNAKLASLGYDLAFTAQGKRVYRAKNPTAQHPFIRVDETISDGANTYNEVYAKSAMVGLIENMTHIDDYEDPTKLQLPLDTTDLKKNWKITGTGTSVVRGWSKWYWATGADAALTNMLEVASIANNNRAFTLVGSSDAFYLLNARTSNASYKLLAGAGLFTANAETLQPNWFLMSHLSSATAAANQSIGTLQASSALTGDVASSKFLTTSAVAINTVSNHVYANPIQPDYQSGVSGVFNASNMAALEIPIFDDNTVLRGVLPIIAYSGKSYGRKVATTPMLADHSMYVYDALTPKGNGNGGVYFYLGELE